MHTSRAFYPNLPRKGLLHRLGVALLGLALSSSVLAQKSPILTPKALPPDVTPKVLERQCGAYTGHYGPFDYRSAHPSDKNIVEKYHFENEYAAFLAGKLNADTYGSSGLEVGKGFQYVLNAFPNHPEALMAMERLGTRLKSERPQGTQYPLECWYVRALKTIPDDPVVRVMYGIYLTNRGRNEEALNNLDKADEELHDDANMQYNIGLMYFKLGKFEKAQLCAMRSSAQGFRLNGLEAMLRKANRWNSQLQLPVPEAEEKTESDPATGKTEAKAP